MKKNNLKLHSDELTPDDCSYCEELESGTGKSANKPGKNHPEKQGEPFTFRFRSVVLFKDAPADLNDGMLVMIRSDRSLHSAFLDPERCFSDSILKTGVEYEIISEIYGGKIYIRNYREVGLKAPVTGRPLSLKQLDAELPEILCSMAMPAGPRVRVSVVGHVRNQDIICGSPEFEICNDRVVYKKCCVLKNVRGNVPRMTEGKKYFFDGLLHSSGLYVYRAEELELFSDDDEELRKREPEAFEGVVGLKKQPTSQDGTFQLEILTDFGMKAVSMDRFSVKCDTVLEEGERYIFFYSDKKEGKIGRYEKIHSYDFFDLWDDGLSRRLDEKIFSLECLERENKGDCALIGIKLIGKARELVKSNKVAEFCITQDGIKYQCVFDRGISYKSEISEPVEDYEYCFDGVLCGETVYIKSISRKQ